MRTIAVHMNGVLTQDRVMEDAYYLPSYLDLGEALASRGATLFLTKGAESYKGGGRYERGWLYQDGTFVFHDRPFEVDCILSKDATFRARGEVEIVNDPRLDELCNDKERTAALFPELCPRTVIATTRIEFLAAINTMPGATVVVKPAQGWGGEGVVIESKEKAVLSEPAFPVLVQEFIDTSGGIPGVMDTYHDYRMIVINGEVVFTFTRTPIKGSLLSNVAQGGMMMPVPAAMRPAETKAFVRRIDSVLSQFGKRFYSIDCARGADGQWKLIELNSPPGQQSRFECGMEADCYFDALADLLLSSSSTAKGSIHALSSACA